MYIGVFMFRVGFVMISYMYILNINIIIMLGVCHKLSKKSGIDVRAIQAFFVISFIMTGGTSVILYLLAYYLYS